MSNLNEEQELAAGALREFLLSSNPQQFFILSGFAGTGKTYLLSQVLRSLPSTRIAFTAPTNKAVKVLAANCRSAGWVNPACLTLHSLLGLKLQADGGVKRLAIPEEVPKLPTLEVLVVDEASMVGKELLEFLQKAVRGLRLKIIFSGDPAQLPPVGEKDSPVWSLPGDRANLTQIMRYKNAILDYSAQVRSMMSHPAPRIMPKDNHLENGEGVHLTKRSLSSLITVTQADFQSPDATKIIAWRNIAVDHYNSLVRRQLFEDSGKKKFLPTDRVILTEPALDLGESGMLLGSTDDEGTVLEVEETEVMGIECHLLTVALDTNRTVELKTPTNRGAVELRAEKDQMAASAKAGLCSWKSFWEFHESFHYVRHSYAITAHRSQGSTYRDVFVDIHDIMRNRDTRESLRCLYVAATRASNRLVFSSTPSSY